jgi:hypothetical protein
VLLTGGSVIGAGRVGCTVVAGAFLAFTPRGSVHGLGLLPPSRVTISAAWLLGLYAAIDLVNTFTDVFGATRTGVGTIAHLAGLMFGFWVRARAFSPRASCAERLRPLLHGATVAPHAPASRRDHATGARRDGPVAARVRAGAADTTSPSERRIRATLAAAYRERDLVLAAQLYRELLAELARCVASGRGAARRGQPARESRAMRGLRDARTRFLDRFRAAKSAARRAGDARRP